MAKHEAPAPSPVSEGAVEADAAAANSDIDKDVEPVASPSQVHNCTQTQSQ